MNLSVRLPTGTLSVRLDEAALPLEALCGFAARHNPRRGFLFVSKVLGKHWPTPAAQLIDVHDRLAAALIEAMSEAMDEGSDAMPDVTPETCGIGLRHGGDDGDDGVVFIGMAETATGLGQGVFEACRRLLPDAPSAYLQTTRYALDGATPLRFEEAHSHATRQLLYVPEDTAARDVLQRARIVVLVDDEISTGNTLCNLLAALRERYPRIDRVVLVCLTDFSEGRTLAVMRALPGVRTARLVALARGSFRFDADPAFAALPPALAYADVGCRRHLIGRYSARLGTTRPLQLPEPLLRRCSDVVAGMSSIAPEVIDADVVPLRAAPARHAARVLVVGTGEFMHPAAVLAHALQQRGARAWVQSTTRSPALPGHAIATTVTVADPYGEGIPNYLYNFDPLAYDAVLVVHEMAPDAQTRALCRTLGAHSVCLADGCVRAPQPLSPDDCRQGSAA